jgi:hypothetical protein
MRFAISVKIPGGEHRWLGVKTILPRQEDAKIFKSRADAQRTIDNFPDVVHAAGLQFVVEPLDTAAKLDCQDPTSDGSSGKASN